MKKILLVLMIIIFIAGKSSGKIYSWKGGLHIATAPLIAGSGIYSSISTLSNTDNRFSRAAAITDLAVLGLQAGGGLVILISNDNLPPVVRTIHRIIGMGVIASGIWLSIANSVDDRVPPEARYTAYGHTTLAAAPLLLFSF